MRTALNAPASALDEHERGFVEKIRKHGWACMQVFEEEQHPGFSYTTGFFSSLSKPEVIVFSLNDKLAHTILSNIYNDLKSGAEFPEGKEVYNVLEALPVCFLNVSKAYYAEYLGWSRWFYGNESFPCQCLVLPDKSGLFPWQHGFDDNMRDLQPDITESGWKSAG